MSNQCLAFFYFFFAFSAFIFNNLHQPHLSNSDHVTTTFCTLFGLNKGHMKGLLPELRHERRKFCIVEARRAGKHNIGITQHLTHQRSQCLG